MAPFLSPLKQADSGLSLIVTPMDRAQRLITVGEVQYFLEEVLGFMRLYGYVESLMRWEMVDGSIPTGYMKMAYATLSISE